MEKQVEPVEIDGFKIYPFLCGSCPLGYLPWVTQICKMQPWLVEVDLSFITDSETTNSFMGDKLLTINSKIDKTADEGKKVGNQLSL